MALDSLIRRGVATANRLMASLQPNVTFEAWTGEDAYGAVTFATGVPTPALVEQKQRLHRTASGREVVTKAKITILRPIAPNGATGRTEPIDSRDRFTLPDGSTGPIVDVEGFVDRGTGRPYFAEIFLGLSNTAGVA